MNESKLKKSSPGHRSGKPRAAGREHILDNALTLFALQGIAGTTVAQIAKASGVTSAMIHYYFSNREGLLDALVTERLAPGIAYVWSSLTDDPLADPRHLIADIVDRLLDAVDRVPQLPLLWSREVLHACGLLRSRVMPLFPVKGFGRLCEAIAREQQSGSVTAGISPALVLTSVMGVVMLPLAARAGVEELPVFLPVDREILRKHALALLLDGLCTRPADTGREKAP